MSQFSKHNSDLAQALKDVLGSKIAELQEHRGQLTAVIKAEHWLDVAYQLRDEPSLGFEQLLDLCGVDYLRRAPRFEVVVNLLSHEYRSRRHHQPDRTVPGTAGQLCGRRL